MNKINPNEVLTEARQYFIDGNYKMAESLLNQLLLQPQSNPEIFQMLATIYYDQGHFSKAIKTFKRALEIDPYYTDASVGLSIILNDLGRYDEGRKIFQEAQKLLEIKSKRNDPFLDEKLAQKHEELADLYFQYSKYAEALEQLIKAQGLSRRRGEITLRIAECYVKLGFTDRAIQDLKNLIQLEPNNLPARLKLGIIYFNLQMIAEATEQWEHILVLDPSHSEALKLLRQAHSVNVSRDLSI